MSFWRFAPYVSVAEKRARALKKLEKMKKKNPDLRPVQIDGRTIARTWWGKSWITNLESYADYYNRISRGRSYVRNNAVLDLRIKPGEVQALVQGSSSHPYSISIKIKEMTEKNWQALKEECCGKLDSLQELLLGKFPRSLAELFTVQKTGLFPAPAEIKFSCSCPDWASMCKHVAATLYGVGARLDQEPALFFTLRDLEMNGLISQAVTSKAQELLKKSTQKTGRVIDQANLSDMFGIEIDEPVLKPQNNKTRRRKEKHTQTKNDIIPAKKKKRRSNPEIISDLLDHTPQGLSVKQIAAQTGWTTVKVRQLVSTLLRQQKITQKSPQIYQNSMVSKTGKRKRGDGKRGD